VGVREKRKEFEGRGNMRETERQWRMGKEKKNKNKRKN